MKCCIDFDCDNAAFGETKSEATNEIARILAELSAKLKADALTRENFQDGVINLFDVNGNAVGYAWLE